MNKPCPCHSQKSYHSCCMPYHHGQIPKDPVALMRSRYSAYALHMVDYIINTTHPDNQDYNSNKALWKKEILIFSKTTTFSGLKILYFSESGDKAWVTFQASLSQNQQDISFTEKSLFLKLDGRWLYRCAEIS